MEGAGGQGSGRRLKPAPNVVTLGLASNTPRRRPLNTGAGAFHIQKRIRIMPMQTVAIAARARSSN